MQFLRDQDTFILKIEKGEEVISTLVKFCQEQNISNAYFSGLGAVKDLSCGYYSLDDRKYYFTKYESLCEVVSLTGNVVLKAGEPFVHTHGVFTDTHNQAFGGHIETMTVGLVVEIILHPLSSKISRTYDEDSGLYMLDCASNQ